MCVSCFMYIYIDKRGTSVDMKSSTMVGLGPVWNIGAASFFVSQIIPHRCIYRYTNDMSYMYENIHVHILYYGRDRLRRRGTFFGCFSRRVYGGLRNVMDAFMVPFLLPLLECAPEGSLARSAPRLGLCQWDGDGWRALSMGLSFFMDINRI